MATRAGARGLRDPAAVACSQVEPPAAASLLPTCPPALEKCSGASWLHAPAAGPPQRPRGGRVQAKSPRGGFAITHFSLASSIHTRW